MYVSLAYLAAILSAMLMFCLAAFQLLLASGVPLGRYAWGGEHERLPAGLRLGSVFAAMIFIAGILVVLGRVGLIPVVQDTVLEQIGIWVLSAMFALSTLGNLMSNSPGERKLMTPIALLLTVLCLVVAVGI